MKGQEKVTCGLFGVGLVLAVMVAEAAVGLLPPHNYSASFHTHTHII